MALGWAYINCSSSGGGVGGASGPSGSLQFMTASGTGVSSGSSNFVYENGTSTLTLSGTLIVRGDITASSFTVHQTDIISGSTIFGNDPSDTHRMTGSLFVGGNDATIFQVSTSLSQSKTYGFRAGFRNVSSSPYTASTADYILGVSATGEVTLRMPSAVTVGAGTLYVVKDQVSARGGNSIYISASDGSGQTIDGANYYELTGTMPAVSLYSNGQNWFVF